MLVFVMLVLVVMVIPVLVVIVMPVLIVFVITMLQQRDRETQSIVGLAPTFSKCSFKQSACWIILDTHTLP